MMDNVPLYPASISYAEDEIWSDGSAWGSVSGYILEIRLIIYLFIYFYIFFCIMILFLY